MRRRGTEEIIPDKEEIIEQISSSQFKFNILESFFKLRDVKDILCHSDSFMLDSGAFSLNKLRRRVSYHDYVTSYIDWINANDINLFFELDIDKLIGYDGVKKIRRNIEQGTKKKPIVVWHKRLGNDEFLKMCKEYDYVAIGGIVSGEIKQEEYKYFPAFIREGHKLGTKIHGLGFTPQKWLPLCHFDSVDSSSWLYGNKHRLVYKFDGKKMVYSKIPPGTDLKTKELALHNLIEWGKFCAYAETHL